MNRTRHQVTSLVHRGFRVYLPLVCFGVSADAESCVKRHNTPCDASHSPFTGCSVREVGW